MPPSKITTHTLLQMKQKGHRITMLTCYDAPSARMLDEAGVDCLLVGDSVGMVVLGYENTLPVTVEDILHHTKAVKRGAKRPMVVADMPFLSYELDPKEAVRNAGRLVKDGGAEAVKLEGGIEVANAVKEIVKANIPVMGHLGLTPQSVLRLGGYRVQGRRPQEAEKILTDAKVLEGAGVFALVLECIPSELAREVSRKVSVPTIGIGAGPHVDGQVLVLHDMLGFQSGVAPKFVKRYGDLGQRADQAVSAFCEDVRSGAFPAAEHEYAA